MSANLDHFVAASCDLVDFADGVARLAASTSEEAGGKYGTEAVAQFARRLRAEIEAFNEALDKARCEPTATNPEHAA